MGSSLFETDEMYCNIGQNVGHSWRCMQDLKTIMLETI